MAEPPCFAGLLAESASTQRALRNAQQRVRRRQAACEHRLAVARFIALEHDLGEAMAARYLEQHWPDEHGREEAIAQLRHWRQGLSQEDVIWQSQLPRTRADSAAAAATAKFRGEAALFRWVHEQNLVQRVAPMSSTILRAASDRGNAPSMALRPKCKTRVTVLQWMRRWRRRWSITLGKIPVRDALSPEVQRAKVQPAAHQKPTAIPPVAQK